MIVADFRELFDRQDNANHFWGTISYQTSSSPNALNVDIVDNTILENKKFDNEIIHDKYGYRLSTKDKNVKWMVDIVDLRQASPITGNCSIWISDWFAIVVIITLSMFALAMFVLMRSYEDDVIHRAKANGVFNVWMFFIPILTLRLYLMWRIAVFPPVSNIEKGEFMLYHLDTLGSTIWTWCTIMILVVATLSLFAWERWGAKMFKSKRIAGKLLDIYSPKAFTVVLILAIVTAVINKVASLPDMWRVLIGIVLPVGLFFANEWRCIKGLGLGYRISSALIVVAMLIAGDAGYAIMFLIFECVYFIILSIVYRNSTTDRNVQTRAARHSIKVFAAIVFLITLFAPQIMCLFYDSKNIISGFEYIKWSNIAFFATAVLIILVLNFILRGVYSAREKSWLRIVSAVFVIGLTIGGPIFFNHMGHFKYRAMIHTQNVGEIMEQEDVTTRNSQRLLEASQNQWFLQYHNDLGSNRITDNGIMYLYPHFKKGVSWNTQISDVICSRYIVGELSLIVPIALIIMCLVLFFMAIKHDNESSTGQSYAMGVSLLLLIQMTFVWMANTNRMIFFGQDLPFLSHNAHSTMIMFATLLAMIMFALGNHADNNNGHDLSRGFHHFARKPFAYLLMTFVVLFSLVFFTGNKYNSLYHEKDMVDAYDVASAMDRATSDLEKINHKLAKFEAKKELTNGMNLKKEQILSKIEKETKLPAEVKKLYDEKEISEFSYSLFNAFWKNYAESNRIGRFY